MSTPGGYTPFFNLILPTVGGNAVDWAIWTNQNWTSVDTALQGLTDGKLAKNPEDGTLYGRMDDEWVQIDVDGSTVTVGIGEAPNDGNPYLRQSLGWVGATTVIQSIVNTSIADVPKRINRNTTQVDVLGDGSFATVYSESVAHSDINGKDLRLVLVGQAFDSGVSGTTSIRVRITFGSTVVYRGQISSAKVEDSAPPIYFDIRIVSVSNTSQLLCGFLAFGASEAVPDGVFDIGSGPLTLSDSTAAASVEGSPIFGLSSENTSGAGTKALTVDLAFIPSGSSSDVLSKYHAILTKE